ncbi:MAG: ABC transporter ATP-binding protein, partial [Patescibacteria group bacterium]|nr:ABC transporter ATP-binding protein [Patescibacteria group bacterium]
MNKYVLEVNNLTKKFGNFTAVNNISFNIKGGEILGFLGPNGAGKTTTIQMLLGVMDQSEGEIKYFGESFEKQRSALLKRINFSSAYIDFPRLFTVKEILKFFAYLYEIPDKDKRIEKLLREFEIEHLKNKTINTLSAGERARLLLTKAFLNYPELIL